MRRLGFWARWAARDLRARWVQVAVLGVVIAIGSGLYAGLSSTTGWRLDSLDASYEALHAHDLHVTLAEGSTLPEGGLADPAAGIGGVATTRERLSLPTQLEVGEGSDAVLVSGRIVGMADVGADGPDDLDGLEVTEGRPLAADEGDQPVALLQEGFAEANDVPLDVPVRLGGGAELDAVGRATSPEWFLVISDQQALYAEASYGVVFTGLATAQAATDRPGEVNDLVLAVDAGADPDAVADEVLAALEAAHPEVGFTVTPLDEEDGYRLLYDDARQDGELFRVFALVVLVGAAFGALNLTRRTVDRQRREIGVGLALGARPALLAVRPLLGGLQIAVVGVVAGAAVGWLVSRFMLSLMQTFLVLPVWEVSIDPGVYAVSALVTIGLVMVGVAWPVARAVRVTPVEALRPRHLARASGRSRRGAGVARRLLPSRTIDRLPFGNVARAPQRLVLTVLALGAATALLFMTSGLLTSFASTIARAEQIQLRTSPDRATVGLAAPTLAELPPVDDVVASPAVSEAEPSLRLGAVADPGEDDEIDLLLEVAPLDSEIWSPVDEVPDEAGLVLSDKALDDLGLAVGDEVVIEHPTRSGATSYALVETALPIVATHDLPLRPLAYLDLDHAGLLGLEDVVNQVAVLPASGDPDDLPRALFEVEGVASVIDAQVTTDTYEELLAFFEDFLVVVQGFLVVLLVLVAFNATSINVDERVREHATMLAMGVRLRTVVRTMVVENALLGLAGAVAGIAAGTVLLWWMAEVAVDSSMPDVELLVSVPASTVAATVVAAVLSVALTPILLVRRVARLDLASSLRVVE